MSPMQKRNVIEAFLHEVECFEVTEVTPMVMMFRYEVEGCCMTIGEYDYQCNVADESTFTKAVKLYLSL